jgi:hypothetical protein
MQRLGQPLDHVAGFMNLAVLDRCVGTEGATDDFAQRFGAIDDEQPADTDKAERLLSRPSA